jgi:EmrB/QacA subfamily drug resistance transporter
MSTTDAVSAGGTPHKGWTLALAALGVFMAALDTLVVTTALPVLRTSLNANLNDLEWTVNAYNLSFACLLLAGAALGDRFGRRRTYAIGLFVFAAASALAAAAPSVGVLVTARALQGGGAAIVMPITLTLISDAFPMEKRGVAIGMWGGVAGMAVAAGPVVGGAVIQGLSWHWIFWFNVPVGLIMVPLAMTRLTESYGPRSRLDIRGLLLAAAGFFGVTWGLVRASSQGWGSAEVMGALAAGVVVLVLFFGWERRAASPMLRLSLFRSRAFTAATGVNFFMFAALFGALFLMSQLFQTGLGNSPLDAGLHILAWTAVPVVISPLAGVLSDKYGNRPFMAAGLALQAVGLGWVAAIAKPGMGYGELTAALVVAGVGIGMVFPTVANAVMNSVPPEETGIASGTSSTFREVGGVFGVAILATVFASNNVFGSRPTFFHHFSHALWVATILSALGVLMALAAPGGVSAAPAEAVAETPEMVTEDA